MRSGRPVQGWQPLRSPASRAAVVSLMVVMVVMVVMVLLPRAF